MFAPPLPLIRASQSLTLEAPTPQRTPPRRHASSSAALLQTLVGVWVCAPDLLSLFPLPQSRRVRHRKITGVCTRRERWAILMLRLRRHGMHKGRAAQTFRVSDQIYNDLIGCGAHPAAGRAGHGTLPDPGVAAAPGAHAVCKRQQPRRQPARQRGRQQGRQPARGVPARPGPRVPQRQRQRGGGQGRRCG